MMNNREIFLRDPMATRLLNDGVAALKENPTPREVETLRYELEHFVCEGQYAEGVIRILESYIGSANSVTQPAAWISGFYGSGKSHLEKMLRHLWVDTRFADGATARGLARLPSEIQELLCELDTLGRRSGGLHAVAGALPSGGGESVRLIVLGMLFRSKGLPESLPQARFCMWLKKRGIYENIRGAVERKGKDLNRELQDLYVSSDLAEAVLEADPDFAANAKEARATLRAQFPVVSDVSTPEFISHLRTVLEVDGRIPATVIILDEVQLFIGDSTQRSTEVQEVAEALCKQMDSRVLLIGAGQTALAGSLPLLQRLRGRFTIPVELSDIDVETVTRRVVLAKKADKRNAVEDTLAAHSGEIDRQLAGTPIATRPEDRQTIVDDYPLLPVRRRFWEKALQAVDAPGTTAQLRTQLRIVHDAVRETAELPLGHVVPADFIFEQLQPDLLRTGVMLREIDETIHRLDDNSPDGKLARRLCGLIFLIRKLPRESGADSGVRATPEMLADLLVSDLAADGAKYRRDVPRILEKLVQDGTLIKLEDGYGLQTRESSEWDREFRNRQTRMNNDLTALASKRGALLGAACQEALEAIKLVQGKSKEPRRLRPCFGAEAPPAAGVDIPVWVRDGWGEKESTVVNDARSAGSDGAIIYIYVPKASADDLQKAIVDCEAAKATLDFKGTPTTPEGREARDAMTTRRVTAEATRHEIVRDLIDRAKVFQGGGNEMFQLNLIEKVRAAAEAALTRMFPKFRDADDGRWASVINRIKNGDEAALNAIDWKDAPEKHPVCAAVLTAVSSGRRGKEVRDNFESSPYGWPRDAVDAALMVLHATGHLRAVCKGAPLSPGQLDQAKISVTDFRAESATISARDKIKLRKMFQDAGVHCLPNQEAAGASAFLNTLIDLSALCGGDPPMPARPAAGHIETLRGLAGVEQLAEMLKQHDILTREFRDWTRLAELAAKRQPGWEALRRLLKHSAALPPASEFQNQAEAVRIQRRLLDSTDPVPEIRKSLSGILRAAVNAAAQEYEKTYRQELATLEANDNWRRLAATDRKRILTDEHIDSLPRVAVGSEDELLSTLERTPLTQWRTKTDALTQQFARAAMVTAQLLEPTARRVHLTSATLKTPEDVRAWVSITERDLLNQLSHGPVVIS